MKLKITLKDPDGVYDSMQSAARESVSRVGLAEGLSNIEVDTLVYSRHEKIAEQCRQWIRYGEYVTIEIDTDAGTAVVCKA